MRKNNIYFYFAALLLLVGCEDFDDKNFDGLDDMTRPENQINKEYTLTADDYVTISGLTVEGVEADALKAVKTNFYLTTATPAHDVIPAFLAKKWFTASSGSAVKVTYDFGGETPFYLSELAAAQTYTVSAADYVTVWDNDKYAFFTPSKNPDKNLPKILAAAFPEAEGGAYVLASYLYSATEPGGDGEEPGAPFTEDFGTVTPNADVDLPGWTNFTEKGTKKTWQGKAYDGNNYVQFSANGSGEAENVGWLITPGIDVSIYTAPAFTFDLKIGYYNAECLQILVSEDFSGDPLTATWKDITANFYLPKEPTSGYSADWAVAGVADMSGYDGKIFIAFKYSGSGTDGKTTTYQLDNVYVGDNVPVNTTEVFKEDFENVTPNADVDLPDWTNFTEKGTKRTWQGKSYGDNKYIQFSANGSGEAENVAWLITPGINISADASPLFSFDLKVGYYNAECLQILISKDFSGDVLAASWEDVTSHFVLPKEPTSGYADNFSLAGTLNLSAYSGKVHIAFKYVGSGTDGKTTTYQIDNVKVISYTASASAIKPLANMITENRLAMYTFNGTDWAEKDNVAVVNPADYKAMGEPGSHNNFSSTIKAENYLPQFLGVKFPYAQEGEVKAVVYSYYTGSANELKADEYIFTGGAWKYNNIPVETVAEQYTYLGKWLYNPNVTLILTPGKGMGTGHFQALADWVWENIDVPAGISSKGLGYVTSYENNEYYFGSSEYQNNFDFRPSAWKQQNGDAYNAMSEEDLKALMWERLPEGIKIMLECMYPDAAPVEGLTVLYTVSVGVYDGSTTPLYTLQYELTGTGEFTYVEDSLKKEEE